MYSLNMHLDDRTFHSCYSVMYRHSHIMNGTWMGWALIYAQPSRWWSLYANRNPLANAIILLAFWKRKTENNPNQIWSYDRIATGDLTNLYTGLIAVNSIDEVVWNYICNNIDSVFTFSITFHIQLSHIYILLSHSTSSYSHILKPFMWIL